MLNLVIVGAGGFGREVVNVFDSDVRLAVGNSRTRLVGLVDDGDVAIDRLERIGVSLLGTTDVLTSEHQYVIGIGSGKVREQIDQRLQSRGVMTFDGLLDRTASVGRDVEIGAGFVICAGSVITTNVRIGRHFHLNLAATVGHDSVIGDYVTMSPGANISGNVNIGNRVTFGTNSSVLPGVQIGDDVYVGAGAMVRSDVASGSTVVGVPAAPI